jgi:hypothetical protein
MPAMPALGLPLSLDQPFRGFVLFTGHPSILPLSQLLCIQYLRRGHPVVLVDAANAYDALLLSDTARAERLDLPMILTALRLSRVYTCHQLETLITETLDPAIETLKPRAVLCLGLLDPLDDEDVPATEATRIFRRMIRSLQDVSRRLPILAACPDPPTPARGVGDLRQGFVNGFRGIAHWHFTAQQGDGGIRITRERPDAARWDWALPPRLGRGDSNARQHHHGRR